MKHVLLDVLDNLTEVERCIDEMAGLNLQGHATHAREQIELARSRIHAVRDAMSVSDAENRSQRASYSE